MNDAKWWCDFMGITLSKTQKVVLILTSGKSLKRMRKVIQAMTEYERGYKRALDDINQPMVVVAKRWNPSNCPRCGKDFREYETCDDGCYNRPFGLERCPSCGQKLDWSRVNS